MKQYNRARVRENSLNSLIKETTLNTNGTAQVRFSKSIEGRTSGCHRERDGRERHQPRGDCPEDRRAQAERESSDGPQEERVSRLHIEDGREHRVESGIADQKTEALVCERWHRA